jgi:O-acetyl-ADP-ribose deacetylase (regulator of RNase III)
MLASEGRTIDLVVGDICGLPVDAIVNAANNYLWMGSGVAGAIKRCGGQVIEEEAVAKGPIAVGDAIVTGAGKLPAKHVIHAAAMGEDLRPSADSIRRATINSMKRAADLKLDSVAFPLLGTGVGGFSVKEATRIMVHAIREQLKSGTSVTRVVLAVLPDAQEAVAAVLAEETKEKK